MFKYTLPYSGEEATIPIVTFENIMNLSRLSYENNFKGYSDYFDNLFNAKRYNLIDKLFIALKARELFVDDNISLNIGGETYNILVDILAQNLIGIDLKRKEYTVDEFTVVLGLPVSLHSTLNYSDLLSSIIHYIKVEDIEIDLRDVSPQQQAIVLAALPPKVLSNIKDYIVSENEPIVIYNGIPGKIEPILLNPFSNDIFNFIKLIFGDYDLTSCRETIFHLSKHITSNAVLTSTCSDIRFYIDEVDKINKANKSSNSTPMI